MLSWGTIHRWHLADTQEVTISLKLLILITTLVSPKGCHFWMCEACHVKENAFFWWGLLPFKFYFMPKPVEKVNTWRIVHVIECGEAKPSPCQGSPCSRWKWWLAQHGDERQDLHWGGLFLHSSTPTPYRRGHSPPICGWHICFVKINTVIITLYYVVIISPQQRKSEVCR